MNSQQLWVLVLGLRETGFVNNLPVHRTHITLLLLLLETIILLKLCGGQRQYMGVGSLYRVGPRDWMKIVSFRSKHLYC